MFRKYPIRLVKFPPAPSVRQPSDDDLFLPAVAMHHRLERRQQQHVEGDALVAAQLLSSASVSSSGTWMLSVAP